MTKNNIIIGDTTPESLIKNIRGAGLVLDSLLKQKNNDASRMAVAHLVAAIELGVMSVDRDDDDQQ